MVARVQAGVAQWPGRRQWRHAAGSIARVHGSPSALMWIALSDGPSQLPRDLLELKVERAWSPATNRDDHYQHRGGDQTEDTLCARGLQEEADDEARKYRAEPTE